MGLSYRETSIVLCTVLLLFVLLTSSLSGSLYLELALPPFESLLIKLWGTLVSSHG
jgi:hypothetical protein